MTNDELIACLGDDAAKLKQANPDDEMAASMVAAIERIESLGTALRNLTTAITTNPTVMDVINLDVVDAALQVEGEACWQEPDDQVWDIHAEALVRQAGLDGREINPNATSIVDLFAPSDRPSEGNDE